MDDNKQNSSRTIMWITVAIAAVLILIVWPLSMIGKGSGDASGDDAELRIQPVARVEMQKVAPPSDGKPRSGETVYNTICKACHDAGVAGAPKTGDKAGHPASRTSNHPSRSATSTRILRARSAALGSATGPQGFRTSRS